MHDARRTTTMATEMAMSVTTKKDGLMHDAWRTTTITSLSMATSVKNTGITQSPSVWWAGAVFKVTRAFGQVQGGLPQEY